jgi:formate hydrogenlyase subunit 6/NADH:ubiquinone oxidoreductase subunit I
MPLVPVPKPTLVQKLKRFFMVDLLKGLGLTLKFNVGALTDRDSVAGKGIYTEQYPKVRPDVAPRFHGAPRLNMDPETHAAKRSWTNSSLIHRVACSAHFARKLVRLTVSS